MKTRNQRLFATWLASMLFASLSVLAEAPALHWAQRAGGTATDFPLRVAVDDNGNSFVVCRIGSSSPTFGAENFTNNGVVVAKYDATGNIQWVRNVGPVSNLREASLGADAAGNCYLGGRFSGQISFGTTSLSAGTQWQDVFIAKYDPLGNLLWVKSTITGNTNNSLYLTAFSVDKAGNSYLAAQPSTSFQIGTNVVGTNPADGTVVAKCNAAGDWVWARDFAVAQAQSAFITRMSADVSGNLFLGGRFSSPTLAFGSYVLTNHGNDDAFVLKCDSNGNVMWAKCSGGTDYDGTWEVAATATGGCVWLVPANGNAYNPRPVFTDDCVVTNARMCLLQLDASGNLLWCRNTVDFGVGFAIWPEGVASMAVDAADNIYLGGYYYNRIQIDGVTFVSPGGDQSPFTGDYAPAFVAKLNPDGVLLWAKQFGGGALQYQWPPISLEENQFGLAVDATGNCTVGGAITLANAPFDNFVLGTAGGEDVFIAQIPADPPRLNFFRNGGSLVIFWPTNQPSFVLEHNSDLTITNSWSTVTNAPAIVGINQVVTNSSIGDSRFFRLRKQ